MTLTELALNIILVILIVLVIGGVILIGYIVIHNLTTPVIGTWQATYCSDSSCSTGATEKIDSGSIYSDSQVGCPTTISVLKGMLPAGKALMPVYSTYYIKSDSCRVNLQSKPTPIPGPSLTPDENPNPVQGKESVFTETFLGALVMSVALGFTVAAVTGMLLTPRTAANYPGGSLVIGLITGLGMTSNTILTVFCAVAGVIGWAIYITAVWFCTPNQR